MVGDRGAKSRRLIVEGMSSTPCPWSRPCSANFLARGLTPPTRSWPVAPKEPSSRSMTRRPAGWQLREWDHLRPGCRHAEDGNDQSRPNRRTNDFSEEPVDLEEVEDRWFSASSRVRPSRHTRGSRLVGSCTSWPSPSLSRHHSERLANVIRESPPIHRLNCRQSLYRGEQCPCEHI